MEREVKSRSCLGFVIPDFDRVVIGCVDLGPRRLTDEVVVYGGVDGGLDDCCGISDEEEKEISSESG